MEGVVKFRASWRYSVRYCRDGVIGIGILLAIAAPLYVLATGRPLRHVWDLLASISGPLILALGAVCALLLILGWLVPVKATPEGIIAGHNRWGKRGIVEWADIRAVAPMEMKGIRMLKLTRTDLSTAYVALPLDRYADLTAYVCTRAGAEHPLTRWLMTAKPDA